MKCCSTCEYYHNSTPGTGPCALRKGETQSCLKGINPKNKPEDHLYPYEYKYWKLFKGLKSEPIDFTIDKSLDRFDF